MKIVSIVGARPQFIKLSPLIIAVHAKNQLCPDKRIEHITVHTGQHYDYKMDKLIFNELGIPEPDYNLEVGSASHGMQTGEMVKRVEEALINEKPDFVLVYGDTNSTLAGALASSKLGIPLAHVESGLRSHNRRMPEEINRILTDHCSDILFCPTENACKNLIKEGFKNVLNKRKLTGCEAKEFSGSISNFPVVINVGDIMYDAALLALEISGRKSSILRELKLEPKKYYLATVHRASNTDNIERLKSILDAFMEVSKTWPVVFPVHPRTKKKLELFNIFPSSSPYVKLIDPVGYLDMLILEKNAKKILTDSGGMQKEAYFFKVPCVTLREETEWVETLEKGINILTGAVKNKIIGAVSQSYKSEYDVAHFGDGRAAERIFCVISSLV